MYSTLNTLYSTSYVFCSVLYTMYYLLPINFQLSISCPYYIVLCHIVQFHIASSCMYISSYPRSMFILEKGPTIHSIDGSSHDRGLSVAAWQLPAAARRWQPGAGTRSLAGFRHHWDFPTVRSPDIANGRAFSRRTPTERAPNLQKLPIGHQQHCGWGKAQLLRSRTRVKSEQVSPSCGR